MSVWARSFLNVENISRVVQIYQISIPTCITKKLREAMITLLGKLTTDEMSYAIKKCAEVLFPTERIKEKSCFKRDSSWGVHLDILQYYDIISMNTTKIMHVDHWYLRNITPINTFCCIFQIIFPIHSIWSEFDISEKFWVKFGNIFQIPNIHFAILKLFIGQIWG